MRCLHFCPVGDAAKLRLTGIPIRSRRVARACGVYAVPLISHLTRNKGALNYWRHQLHQDRHQRFASVIFEIPDDEQVFFFDDFASNGFWIAESNKVPRTALQAFALKPAKIAEREAAALAENYATSTEAPWSGSDVWHAQYTLLLAEVIVPRAISPKEIRSIRFPPKRQSRARRHLTQMLEMESYM